MPRPFDERPALCDNRPVQRPRLFVRSVVRFVVRFGVMAALAWLAAAGCDKPNDQPVLQQEVLAIAREYDHRLDALSERADDIERRFRALPGGTLDSAPAEHRFGQARAAIGDRRGYLMGVRARLAAKPGSVAELHALVDEMRARLDDGVREASDDLAAVESWIATAPLRPRAGAQPAPEPPAPAPGSDEDTPETDRSGAPIR
jgi:hypothetical protein